MALKKQIKKFGIVFNEAYSIVESVEWRKKNEPATVRILTFANEAARQSWEEPIDNLTIRFDYDLNLELNIIEQAYEALKQRAEFSDAVNV